MQVPWRYSGLLVQAAMVAGVVAVPMIYPEVLTVELPQPSLVLAPLRRAMAPREAERRPQRANPESVSLANRANVRREYVPNFRSQERARPNEAGAELSEAPAMELPWLADTVQASSALRGNGPFDNRLGRLPEARRPAEPPPAKEKEKRATQPLPVGGKVQEAKLLQRVLPVYPSLAKQMRIQGTVNLRSIIAKDGTVQYLEVLEGHPFLAKAALEAVRQWRYQPTLLNGEPVEVVTTIAVNFRLGAP